MYLKLNAPPGTLDCFRTRVAAVKSLGLSKQTSPQTAALSQCLQGSREGEEFQCAQDWHNRRMKEGKIERGRTTLCSASVDREETRSQYGDGGPAAEGDL